MELVPYTPDLAPDLSAFYNDLVRDVPHCHPTKPEHWTTLLQPVLDPRQSSPYRFHRRLENQQVVIALENDTVLGFVHCALRLPKRKSTTHTARGIIPFLAYARGQRAIGQALLEKAEALLRAHGITRVHAFPDTNRYPFYHLDNATLSDRLEHIQALLVFNGYSRTEGEIFLDWPDFKPVLPPLLDTYGTIAVTLTQKGKSPLPNIKVEAMRSDQSLGECDGHAFGHFDSLNPDPNWLFIGWLGVKDAFQDQKLGLYLLQRTLAEMHDVGYRHATISTSSDNHRALLFYSNHGFRMVDWTYEYVRELS